MNSQLRRIRSALVEAALLQEPFLGHRASFVGDIGEIDAALFLQMSDDEVRACNVGKPNKVGYDLVHNGVRYQVKALRISPTNGKPLKNTVRLPKDGFDVLIHIVYETDFRIRSIYRLTRDEANANATYSNHRIPFNRMEAFKINI